MTDDSWLPKPPWRDFYNQGWDFKDRWMPIASAVDRLAMWEGSERAKSLAIDHLKSGLWTGRASKAYIRVKSLKLFGASRFMQQIGAMHRKSGANVFEVAHLSGGAISPEFWLDAHKTGGSEWSIERVIMFPEAGRFDLERGEAEGFHGLFAEDLEEGEFCGILISFFGVEISEDEVDAVAPARTFVGTTSARSTTFDWEAAFADVAARLYFDLEFEDVNGRGVQKTIIDALRSSFERRKLRVPEDSSLKAKARVIVAALRAK